MSFRLFLYYCALCGGWAAFVVWGLVQLTGIARMESTFLKVMLIGALLGALVAASVGWIDSLLNATGAGRFLRVLVCGTLGLLGGAIGGLVGQALNSYLHIPVFVGWMLAGVLIGASIGAMDVLQSLTAGKGTRGSCRKLINGLYGGLLGGFVGGLPFTFLQHSTQLPNSGLTISLVLLGTCIGLMIGLAQVILKEAWLVVVEGIRAGREMPLVKEETTIGRAESCDLGLYGDADIAKLHARIIHKNNRYLLTHAGECGTTLVNDTPVGKAPVVLQSGDAIRMGRSVVRFRVRQR